jgi:hypothetical protein
VTLDGMLKLVEVGGEDNLDDEEGDEERVGLVQGILQAPGVEF